MKASLVVLAALCLGSAAALHSGQPVAVRSGAAPATRPETNLALRGGASIGPITQTVGFYLNMGLGVLYACHATFAPNDFLKKFYGSSTRMSPELTGITRWFGLVMCQYQMFCLWIGYSSLEGQVSVLKWSPFSSILPFALYISQFQEGLMESKEAFLVTPLMAAFTAYLGYM
eukprot:CAMPEP_0181291892 /NCGR_PEP_ID=MMETSP1101-20121128/2212_1 /TAXON_ID=46948 /ORGANISM="Rhodomonas abbreviata, Strain Caron Lab Isolate" /LENGTH=172 /DNA_ID=CAMNT_0023396319 /DNA_START=23 /DNA_END=541 /DNA_ORIENTATION=-